MEFRRYCRPDWDMIHAMSVEGAVEDFFSVCNMLFKFLRKLTIAAKYKGETLKRLLEQQWTGHLATVKCILKSLNDISAALTQDYSVQ